MSHDSTEQMVTDALRAGAPVNTNLEEGLAALHGRIEGGNVASMTISDPGRPRRTLVYVIAAALLLVGAVAVTVAVRSGNDPVQVATEPVAAGTGWYLPEGLGNEWRVESVATDFRDAEDTGADCPCLTWMWTEPDAGRSAYVKRALASGAPAVVDGDPADLEPVDLDGGVSGTYVTGLFGPYLMFEQDDYRWLITGFELPKADVVDMASRIAAGRDPAPPSDSFGLLESYQTLGGISAYQDVHVVLQNQATEARVAYVLSPPGRGPDWGLVQVMPASIDLSGVIGQGISAGDPEVEYVFRLDDADISSDSSSGFGVARGTATEKDLQAMLQSLRPATAGEWATFVRSATDRGADEAIAPTIDDLSKPTTAPTTSEPN